MPYFVCCQILFFIAFRNPSLRFFFSTACVLHVRAQPFLMVVHITRCSAHAIVLLLLQVLTVLAGVPTPHGSFDDRTLVRVLVLHGIKDLMSTTIGKPQPLIHSVFKACTIFLLDKI